MVRRYLLRRSTPSGRRRRSQYVGLDGKIIGLHRFGLSGPGDQVMKEFGIEAQHVIAAAKALG